LHRTCAILSNSTFRNAGAHAAHAILGHDGKSPEEIRRTGRLEIEAYRHAEFIDATIMKVYKENSSRHNHEVFVAEDQQGNRWAGRSLVIATGSKDVFPDLPGFVENWPDNIYQCLVCDGHERADLPKGILAYPQLTILACKMATVAHFESLPPGAGHDATFPPTPSKVTVFTNGPANPHNDKEITRGLHILAGHGITVDERPIQKLVRDPKEGLHVHFTNSETAYMGYLFFKPASTPHSLTQTLISHFGLDTTSTPFGSSLTASVPTMSTNVPGIFVAGDAGNGMGNGTNAIHTGVAAAAGVTHFVNELDDEIALKLWMDAQKPRKEA